jgi:hypothetical protein
MHSVIFVVRRYEHYECLFPAVEKTPFTVIYFVFIMYLCCVELCCCLGDDIMFINLSLLYVARHCCTKGVYLVN